MSREVSPAALLLSRGILRELPSWWCTDYSRATTPSSEGNARDELEQNRRSFIYRVHGNMCKQQGGGDIMCKWSLHTSLPSQQWMIICKHQLDLSIVYIWHRTSHWSIGSECNGVRRSDQDWQEYRGWHERQLGRFQVWDNRSTAPRWSDRWWELGPISFEDISSWDLVSMAFRCWLNQRMKKRIWWDGDSGSLGWDAVR